MTVLMGLSLKTSIRYLPRFSDLTSPAFSKTSMCLAIACREMATLCRIIKRTETLVKRLLLALGELVQHQPPCWVCERLED